MFLLTLTRLILLLFLFLFFCFFPFFLSERIFLNQILFRRHRYNGSFICAYLQTHYAVVIFQIYEVCHRIYISRIDRNLLLKLIGIVLSNYYIVRKVFLFFIFVSSFLFIFCFFPRIV